MGNKSSRVKGSSKSMKSQRSMKGSKTAFRTRSLNSLPQQPDTANIQTKPIPVTKTRDRKAVVSCDRGQEDAVLRNPTQHRRQNTAPEITLQTSPRSLKLSDFSKVVHQPEVSEDSDQEVFIDFNAASEPSPEELCHICSVYTGKIKFLCRICYQVYHLGCLQKLEQHSPSPVVCYLKRAETELGWSCHQCDNLVRLLSEQEVTKLISTIEQYNIKQDVALYRQQYICYKKAVHRDQYKEEITDERLTDERSIFDKLDIKRTGYISWVEFINSEAVRVLEKRTKNQLIKLLTPGELYRARQTFLKYDHDRDGEITRFESRMAQMQYFKDISCFPTPTSNKLLFADEEIGGVINWMDFLRDQAICIIASRRNSFCKDAPKPTDPVDEPVDKPLVKNISEKRDNQTSKVEKKEPSVQPLLNTGNTDQDVQRNKNVPESKILCERSDVPSTLTQINLPTDESKPRTDIDRVLLRSTRSKSTTIKGGSELPARLPKPPNRSSAVKSADHATAQKDDLAERKLRKVSNIVLHDEEPPQEKREISNSRESLEDNKGDVVRRFPKKPRGQTMSMYVYESKRRVSSDNASIRRPVSVVGFKMEPTDLVSKLSVKLKTRDAAMSQNSIHRLLLKEQHSFDGQQPKEKLLPDNPSSGNQGNMNSKNDNKTTQGDNTTNTKPNDTDDLRNNAVEKREREDLFQESKPEPGKYRASDSAILKTDRPKKSSRGQTNSLFVTRSERAILLNEQKDRRPMSLG